MIVFNQLMLTQYLENDWIQDLILDNEIEEDKMHRTHLWLKEMDNKRLIFSFLYGDVLKMKQKDNFKVIDVGGVLCIY